ncbi:MAG: hypothetical protein PVJ38_03050 [Candidatus Bathyarchaeota archaeon]|jgi:hypothetical protein
MDKEPYDPDLITPDVYGDRRPVKGEIVALLHITFKERGLELITARSRGLRKGEIHELMVTDEEGVAPGGGADRVSALAFFEVLEGGLAVVGDEVSIAGRTLGRLAGYDLTHMPNHMNVVVKAGSLETEAIAVGELIEFTKTN